MLGIIKFELKKFIKDKKNYLLIILFIILSFTVIKEDKNFFKNEIKVLKMNLDIKNELINSYKSGLDTSIKESSAETKLIKERYLKKTIKEKEIVENILDGLENKKYDQYYKNKIAYRENDIKSLSSPELFSNRILPNAISEEKNQINILKQLLNKKISLIDIRKSNEGFNFIRRLLNEKFLLIIIVFILLIASPIFSSEYDNKTNKLLFTQSLSKNKIFLGKFISIMIINISVIFSTLLINFIYMGIKNGFGTLEYVLQGFRNYKIVTMSMKTYILYELFLLFLIILLISAMTSLISCIFNNIGICIFTNFAITGALYMFTKQKYLLKFNAFNVFEYLDINRVVEGIPWITSGYQAKPPEFVTIENGMMYFTIISIILLVIALLYFNKKEAK